MAFGSLFYWKPAFTVLDSRPPLCFHDPMTKRQLMLLVFGDAVYRRRYQKGLTQQMLADRAGLHRSYIADIENGARNPSLQIIVQIAKALDVPPASLLRGLR